MAFLRVTLYSKIFKINSLNRNKYFNKGLGTRVSPLCTVIKDIKNEDVVSVADYYSGKSVFITGGTGFLGKTYIQKLLYSCPKINKIYMLVRANSKEEAENRVTQMVDNSTQLFNLLKEDRPGDLVKLIPIVGDLSSPNLGIHPDAEKLLREEVSIIVHSAATINLTDTLQVAFKINVTGTQNLLALAKRMKNLQAFLHISTTFCTLTAGKEVIEEMVYPLPLNPYDIQKTLAKYGHMRFPPENILGGNRNTYLFTKAISESMIQLNNDELPTAIIRPSLIGSSNIEPYKGWLDVMNIHSYLMYTMALGHIRVLNIDKNTIWDFIPVDYVANLMILAAIKCKRWVKSYRKLMELSDNIHFYGGHSWRLKPDRVISLISTLNEEDRRNFPCDPSDIEWFEYFKKYSDGVRNYILKNKKSKTTTKVYTF